MRKIIHIDCDCFYAAVEMRDFPELLGKPVAVGGYSKRRGVLATCNYQAREYGLHAAMPTVEAFIKCPHLQLMPARFDVYRQVSAQMHEIFQEYTHMIEPLSLDEAFLDVTDCTLLEGSATYIAFAIREKIYQQLGITASAGIAPNKFLAKVASDWQKPNAQTLINPDQVKSFVSVLPLKKIPGVGRVTLKKMQRLGLETCGDLQVWPEGEIVRYFGKLGARLIDFRFGVDDRPVVTSRHRKSLSVEKTYEKNLQHHAVYDACLIELYEELIKRLHRFTITLLRCVFSTDSLHKPAHTVNQIFCQGFKPVKPLQLLPSVIRSLQLKVKLSDFTMVSREIAFECELLKVGQCLSFSHFAALFDKYLQQYFAKEKAYPEIRLLGLGVNFRVNTVDDKALDSVGNNHLGMAEIPSQLNLF